MKGRPLQAGARHTFDEISRRTGWPRATVYRIYRGVFARMDERGIPQPRERRRRQRVRELAAA